MTKQELYLKYNELLRVLDIPELINQIYLKAVKSGALNIEAEENESYRLPRIILHAAFCELADQFQPVDPDNLMESETLQRFL